MFAGQLPPAEALRRWDGDGAVRLLDHDDEHHALLLERLEPGQHLSTGIEPDAALWECLGETRAGAGDNADAARCYRNALRMERGEAVEVSSTEATARALSPSVESSTASMVRILSGNSGRS